MKILVISDTHGNDAAIARAFRLCGPTDLVVHCGDGESDTWLLEAAETVPVVKVAGNCDTGSTAARELLGEWNGKRVLICHGDRYGVKTGLSALVARGRELEVHAVLFGHTHRALVETDHGMLLLNPGTLFSKAPFQSCAVLEITDAGLTATILPLP